jgi:hypothetical protein
MTLNNQFDYPMGFTLPVITDKFPRLTEHWLVVVAPPKHC